LRDTTVTIIMKKWGRETRKFIVLRFRSSARSSLWYRYYGKLILCKEIITVCSEIHTEHILVNTLHGQNAEFLDVIFSGT
jgi:hypothetical protein